MFCVWGLVLSTSSWKNSNKTILGNSKITPFHCQSRGAILNVTFLRARITYRQESAGKIPRDWGMGSSFTFSQARSFRFKKKIHLLLNQLKFEKTENAFIKSIHSGLWQNFLLLLAQMVVEQKANKLFNCSFYYRTFLGKSNHGHF